MKNKNELNNNDNTIILLNNIEESKKKKNKKPFFYTKLLVMTFILLFFISIFINMYLVSEIKIYKKKLSQSNSFENKQILLANDYNNKTNNTIIISNIKFSFNLLNKVKEIYEKNGIVNINEIESTIPEGRNWTKIQNKTAEINVGAGFDEKYLLPSILTFASIMDSQKKETKLRFHFAVVDAFSVENMLKIYKLRELIREDVEFIFYNAKKVETDLKDVNTKGNSLCARLLLPELLPEDVERIIIFDTGDLIVIRDLSEMYNWNMENNIYCGIVDPLIGRHGVISKKPMDIYINGGNYLIDVKKVKSEKMYEKYVEHKDAYKNAIADQDLINDIAFGRIGYLPMRFGAIPPFSDDKSSDAFHFVNRRYIERVKNKERFPFLPKDSSEFNLQGFNPVVIHQWNSKWMDGAGLTIYRRIAQYYIKYAGIWDEMCQKYPGYCKK